MNSNFLTKELISVWRVRMAFGVSVLAFSLPACDSKVPDSYKRYMCSEAERGSAHRCEYLDIPRDTCTDIAGEAFRLCYESLPEEYAD